MNVNQKGHPPSYPPTPTSSPLALDFEAQPESEQPLFWKGWCVLRVLDVLGQLAGDPAKPALSSEWSFCSNK